MLILSRKPGQSIMIGDDIEVTVLEWQDGQVSLGITAPRQVPVHRREVYEAIARENQAAAAPTKLDLAKLPRRS
ncbi:MAG TPA: carbon storage regulator CsrA [Firmicutes bacterium]|uniref:carbon storage regulator CsrA n=1 Tax=Gelria sp. Kuro-4 TaxID=2796927 RepID=UPI00199A355A|nr:carbon storage regulator CsrA [Gelria sp. Kuro-4]BCV25525.1 carbon storage regulator [Gelria sp. Kuro-4]HHV56784.1 carbon storage regulator CsrA [Bacillota bacterium]